MSLSPRSISISWEPPPLEDRNGDIIGYSVNVTAIEIGDKFHLSLMGTSLTQSFLRPFTTYEFRLAALTPAGVGPFSSVYRINTPEDGNNIHSSAVHNTSVNSTFSTDTYYIPVCYLYGTIIFRGSSMKL